MLAQVNHPPDKTYDLTVHSPDMVIVGSNSTQPTQTLCFSPDGRVLSQGGLPISQDSNLSVSSDCVGLGFRFWIAEKGSYKSSDNPLGDPSMMAACEPSSVDKQRQARLYANFWVIQVPFNGSIKATQ